jgi:hypothetical protein
LLVESYHLSFCSLYFFHSYISDDDDNRTRSGAKSSTEAQWTYATHIQFAYTKLK